MQLMIVDLAGHFPLVLIRAQQEQSLAILALRRVQRSYIIQLIREFIIPEIREFVIAF